jgi:hypothetical protein
MAKLCVHSFAVSIDGYGAGPEQSLEHPLGVRGPELMDWFFPTRVWRKMHGDNGGETGRQPICRAGLCPNRRLDPRAQYVRSRARVVAGRELERLVGR